MTSLRIEMLKIGFALIFVIPTTALVLLVTIIGIPLLPIMLILFPFVACLGILVIIFGLFNKNKVCQNCRYVK